MDAIRRRNTVQYRTGEMPRAGRDIIMREKSEFAPLRLTFIDPYKLFG